MEYLALDQVRERVAACRAELEALLGVKALAGKPKARQWRFLRDAAECLWSGIARPEFEKLSNSGVAQLKFEAEDRLRRFYLRPGRSPRFVFTLVHQSELGLYSVSDDGAYPSLAGYCLLVRDLSVEQVGERTSVPDALAPYLEKVVTAGIDAEFEAYAALPEIRVERVGRWFVANGPAYCEIVNLVTRHQQRGWVISNPLNPSTKRLLEIRLKKLDGKEAILGATEYWYLRWWSTKEQTYVYPYRETNHQLYILRDQPDGWQVYQNLRPSPRSSVPSRWHSKRSKSARPPT